MSDSKTLFEKNHSEIPADIVYEDDNIISFWDIDHQAPFHILVCLKSQSVCYQNHPPIFTESFWVIFLLKSAEIAAKEGYKDKFRIIVNNGAEAGQSVFHLHIHVAGRHLNWPPGC